MAVTTRALLRAVLPLSYSVVVPVVMAEPLAGPRPLKTLSVVLFYIVSDVRSVFGS